MKAKKGTGVYAYLDKLGLLTNGTEQEIIVAKVQYWRQVRVNWQKNKRASNKKYEVLLNTVEYQIIAKAAKVNGRSMVAYIKEATLAYTRKQYLVPKQEILYELKELLTVSYCSIQELIETKHVPVSIADILLTRIEHLENRILSILFNPYEVV